MAWRHCQLAVGLGCATACTDKDQEAITATAALEEVKMDDGNYPAW